jgi:50S ribosomal protein L16 3-hydroxylase
MQLTKFDTVRFLAEYWQQKPMLIRNPWAEWTNPLSPDDLAGMACEADVESRLITLDDGALSAEDGPVPENRFGRLGRAPWTLLVQAVDQYIPEVAALVEPFRFIPDWRIDDVMVSYATDGGGVGAHYDQYDVFLIQGLGTRRWQVGGYCDDNTPLLPHDDLRLLADFEPAEEWLLEPGDILYVPPGFSHNGVAVGDDCMTYSVGFRAPARSELIGDYCEHVIDQMPDDDRYTDPQLVMQDNPGEISTAAIAKLHKMVTERLNDSAAFALWFGQYNSTPKYPDIDWRPDFTADSDYVCAMLAQRFPLARNPASRMSFIRHDGGIWLFVDGKIYDCQGDTAKLAERLCALGPPEVSSQMARSADCVDLMVTLLNQGSLVFESH